MDLDLTIPISPHWSDPPFPVPMMVYMHTSGSVAGLCHMCPGVLVTVVCRISEGEEDARCDTPWPNIRHMLI